MLENTEGLGNTENPHFHIEEASANSPNKTIVEFILPRDYLFSNESGQMRMFDQLLTNLDTSGGVTIPKRSAVITQLREAAKEGPQKIPFIGLPEQYLGTMGATEAQKILESLQYETDVGMIPAVPGFALENRRTLKNYITANERLCGKKPVAEMMGGKMFSTREENIAILSMLMRDHQIVDKGVDLSNIWDSQPENSQAIQLKGRQPKMRDILFEYFDFSEAEREAFLRGRDITVINLSVLSLANRFDPNDSIKKQFILETGTTSPLIHLIKQGLGFDGSSEGRTKATDHVYRKLSPTGLVIVTNPSNCEVYCKGCQRERFVQGIKVLESDVNAQEITYDVRSAKIKGSVEALFDEIKSMPRLKYVIFSGGDAFSMNPADLEQLSSAVLTMNGSDSEAINKRSGPKIRFATRDPFYQPWLYNEDSDREEGNGVNRLDVVKKLCKEYKGAIELVLHLNSPAEVTEGLITAIRNLQDAGIHQMKTQTVYWHDLNDQFYNVDSSNGSIPIPGQLMRTLSLAGDTLGMSPYYVFLPKYNESLYRTPGIFSLVVAEQIMRDRLVHSNMPKFAIDDPFGTGKSLIPEDIVNVVGDLAIIKARGGHSFAYPYFNSSN